MFQTDIFDGCFGVFLRNGVNVIVDNDGIDFYSPYSIFLSGPSSTITLSENQQKQQQQHRSILVAKQERERERNKIPEAEGFISFFIFHRVHNLVFVYLSITVG